MDTNVHVPLPQLAAAVTATSVPFPLNELRLLCRQMKVPSLRPAQVEAIRSLAYGRQDTWVSLPCGGGKSLVFAAALWLIGGVGVLVEPLSAIIVSRQRWSPTSRSAASMPSC